MTALAAPVRPHLVVLEGGKAKRGRPSKQDDALLELAMRAHEERAMADQLRPILRRLRVVARTAGANVHRDLAALDYLCARHARRWADEDEGRAA